MLTLNGGETGRVFWSVGSCGKQGGQIQKQVFSELDYVFFVPGDYHVTAQIRFWLRPTDAKDALYTLFDSAEKKYSLYTIPSDAPPASVSTPTGGVASQSATVRLVTPQSVLLLGAAIGGLFAFFIRRRQITTETQVDTGRWWIIIQRKTWQLLGTASAATGAMLLSIIITILLNRISESQFVIRVTIADFWGAIAVGFLATYSGASVLARLVGQTETTQTVVTEGGRNSTSTERTVKDRGSDDPFFSSGPHPQDSPPAVGESNG